MRKKELKRNKEARTKTREVITLKKDTGALDAEVRRLTQAGRYDSRSDSRAGFAYRFTLTILASVPLRASQRARRGRYRSTERGQGGTRESEKSQGGLRQGEPRGRGSRLQAGKGEGKGSIGGKASDRTGGSSEGGAGGFDLWSEECVLSRDLEPSGTSSAWDV